VPRPDLISLDSFIYGGKRAKMPKIEDLTKFSVAKLKSFLKERNIPGNGTKSELLQLSRLYYNRPVLRVVQQQDQQEKGKDVLFDRADLQWSVITSDTRVQV
jgi:hypothetical protein